jgi:hypothetical protein
VTLLHRALFVAHKPTVNYPNVLLYQKTGWQLHSSFSWSIWIITTTDRKNWFFVGSERGGRAAALFMSLFKSCKDLDINPWEYLDDTLRRMQIVKNPAANGFIYYLRQSSTVTDNIAQGGSVRRLHPRNAGGRACTLTFRKNGATRIVFFGGRRRLSK